VSAINQIQGKREKELHEECICKLHAELQPHAFVTSNEGKVKPSNSLDEENSTQAVPAIWNPIVL
jgi:hypothetical protein